MLEKYCPSRRERRPIPEPSQRTASTCARSEALRKMIAGTESGAVNAPITGATVDGKTWADEADKVAFIAHVDPLIQRQVVNAVVEAYTAKLSD